MYQNCDYTRHVCAVSVFGGTVEKLVVVCAVNRVYADYVTVRVAVKDVLRVGGVGRRAEDVVIVVHTRVDDGDDDGIFLQFGKCGGIIRLPRIYGAFQGVNIEIVFAEIPVFASS